MTLTYIEIMDWIAYVQVEKEYEQKQSAFYGRWTDQHEDEYSEYPQTKKGTAT